MKHREGQFRTESILDQKAIVTEAGDGDLIIEGWAADVAVDDLDEYFDEKALTEAASTFMAHGNRPLLFHHKPDMQLGEVLNLEPRTREDGSFGLWMKARVDQPAPSHPVLADAYQKIKRGTMKGLSVAGKWFGEQTPEGWRIVRAAFREISVAPLPVNPNTLAGLAGKAVQEWDDDDPAEAERLLERANALADTLEALAERRS